MRRILAVFILLLTIFSTGCQSGTAADEQALHVAALTSPLTLNPLFLRDSAAAEAAGLLHPQLLVTDPVTLTPQPRLFTSWQVGEDNLTYTFTLHEDAYWSDGRPITAADVAFTLQVICHPDYTGWLFLPLRYILGAEGYKQEHRSPLAEGELPGVQIIDEKTLQIRLKEPYAPFISMLTFAPLPAHLLEDVPVAELEAHPYSQELSVSAGPYLLVDWQRAEYSHVRANPHYFLGKPAIENIYYRFIPNQEAQLIELLAGKLDLIPTAVKLEDIKTLEQNPDITVHTNPRLVYDYLVINSQKKDSALAKKEVRQVLAMLIDREEIVNNILLGYGEPLYGPLLPLHFAYQQKDNNYKVDLAAARRLLVEAGGTDLKLTLIYNVGNTVRENVALMLKEKAAAIGLEIEIKLLEWEAFLAALNNGDYDLAILGRGVEADPDLSFHWHSQSPGNSLAYHNKQVDQLLTQAVTTSERSKRAKLYREAEELIIADIPAVWLYARQAVHAATARLKNFTPHPEAIFFNVHEWTLDAQEETP